jgi:hypothetical protein
MITINNLICFMFYILKLRAQKLLVWNNAFPRIRKPSHNRRLSPTLLGCVLAVCVRYCVETWQFVYIVGLNLGSLSIYAQLIMQCCNVVLRNDTACFRVTQKYVWGVSFSIFVTCKSHFNMIYILHSWFMCVENKVMCKTQIFCFLGLINVITLR